jgi:hypothetical protein
MPGKSIDDDLRSLGATLMASNPVGNDKKISKGGGGTGNAVLIFGAFLADVALHAD